MLVINMVSRLNSLKDEVTSRVLEIFPIVGRYGLEEDLNEIVFATKNANFTDKTWKTSLQEAAIKLNTIAKKNLSSKSELLDINHFYKNLQIITR